MSKIPEYAEILSNKHYKYLGGGVHGTVKSLTSSQVIKISSSKREAKLAESFIGKSLPHIVKVYEVKKVKGKSLWLIRMERLYKHRLCWAQGHIHILKGLVSFARMGYYYWDLHEENIMYDRKTKCYKIIDLASLSTARRIKCL